MRTVLIVDDTEAHRLIHRTVIEGLLPLDVDVEEADGPTEALAAMHRLADQQASVLVFTDHVMPGRTGLQLVRTFANEHPDARFRYVLVTSLVELAAADDEDRAAVHEIMDKPADLDEMEAGFKRVIEEWLASEGAQEGQNPSSRAAEVK